MAGEYPIHLSVELNNLEEISYSDNIYEQSNGENVFSPLLDIWFPLTEKQLDGVIHYCHCQGWGLRINFHV